MEAVGAGASLVTFIVLGLQCSKLIHNTLSAIKDGPQIVQRVADNVLQLHYILEKLNESRAVDQDVALRGQIQLCVQELNLLATRIAAMQAVENESPSGRCWRRLKSVLNEKSLHLIDSQIRQQVVTLNLRLDIHSSNVIHESRGQGIEIKRTVNALDASMQTQYQFQKSRFDNLQTTISTGINESYSAMQAELSSIRQTIEATSSISAQEISSMHALLQQVRDHASHDSSPVAVQGAQISVKSDGSSYMAPLRHTDDASDCIGADREMTESIDRLCSLIQEKERTLDNYSDDDDQANAILEDLQTLLRSVQKQQIHGIPSTGRAEGPFARLSDSGLHRFGRSFGQGELSLNRAISKKRSCPIATPFQQSRSYSQADIGVGALSLSVRKRARPSTEDGDDMCHPQEKPFVDYEMTLVFLSGNPQRPHMLVASVLQQELFKDSVSSVSRVVVNRVLPSKSPVFKIVRKGQLQLLQRMLQNGKASLRDHDEHGASLLFYAMEQPDMCKFLVDSGLEVDHVASVRGLISWEEPELLVPLQVDYCFQFHWEEESNDFTAFLQCRRLLLEAGADPTIIMADTGQSSFSFLQQVVLHDIPEAIPLAWNPGLVCCLPDIDTHGYRNGRSLFLQVCENMNANYIKEIFGHLIGLGADVHQRDDLGNTCLHRCLMNVGVSIFQEFEAIKYLLEKGANPSAINNRSYSVSHIAYTTHGRRKFFRIPNSVIGDLWDAALHGCGFDIAEFRQGHQREAIYTAGYFRYDFECLWRGMESECPYWDDKPWPPLEPGGRQRLKELGGDFADLYGNKLDEEEDTGGWSDDSAPASDGRCYGEEQPAGELDGEDVVARQDMNGLGNETWQVAPTSLDVSASRSETPSKVHASDGYQDQRKELEAVFSRFELPEEATENPWACIL